jgi:hypothetical protein
VVANQVNLEATMPLELAQQIGNVSQGYKMMGYSRDNFIDSRS